MNARRGMALALGVGVGTAMGIALNDWNVGISLGAAMVVAIMVGGRRRGPDNNEDSR